MRINKHDVPTVIDAPGAIARQLDGFGEAAEPMAAEHFLSLPAPTSPRCCRGCLATGAMPPIGVTSCRVSLS